MIVVRPAGSSNSVCQRCQENGPRLPSSWAGCHDAPLSIESSTRSTARVPAQAMPAQTKREPTVAPSPGTTSTFTVDLTALESDEDRRDGRVQDALDTAQFPTATFTVVEVTGYDPSVPQDQQQTFTLAGTLDLHGVQRDVSWEVEARREGNVITALATLTIDFADFDITPPNIAGFVSISNEATLQVQVIEQAV